MESDTQGFWKRFFSPKDQVHKHWYSPIDNFEFASSEFYEMIEKELLARKVPGLAMSRVDLCEGGLLSDKREYLRLKRERLVFDICAAPFGTSYFFSFRFVELPLGIKPWEVVIFLICVNFTLGLFLRMFGIWYGLMAFITFAVGTIWLMRNALLLGLKNLDQTLLNIPVIGAIYEVFFRKETYYRQDTRLMYLSTVNGITEKLLEEVTLAKGIKLVKRYDRKPIYGELYQERPNPPGERGDGAPLEKAA